MHRRAFVPLAAVLIGGMAGSVSADVIDVRATADNHYAIYNFLGGPTGDGASLSFIGRNEVGDSGDPGEYNWSLPEDWQFENTTGCFYIAAWSDDEFYQALLAQVFRNGTEAMHTGGAMWSVYPTGLDLDDPDAAPSNTAMENYIANANSGSLWETPYVGGANGVAPWGVIPGVTTDAHWTWWNTPGDIDPTTEGTDAGEFIIFRVCYSTVPTPGSVALAGLAAGLLARRRR